jgi:hypothetical protein
MFDFSLQTCNEAQIFVCHEKIFEALLWFRIVCQLDTLPGFVCGSSFLVLYSKYDHHHPH